MDAHRIKPNEVMQRLDQDHDILFIDARSDKAWQESDEVIPGSVRIPADKVADHLEALPRDKTIVTYCT